MGVEAGREAGSEGAGGGPRWGKGEAVSAVELTGLEPKAWLGPRLTEAPQGT